MANNTPSFRYPFTLPKDTHPQVANALRSAYNSLSDLNQAIEALNTKVGAITPSAAATALALAVSGIPNSDQERLNLQSANGSVTLSDLGSGNIDLSAASGGLALATANLGWVAPACLLPFVPTGSGALVTPCLCQGAATANQLGCVQFLLTYTATVSAASMYVVTGGGAGFGLSGIYSADGNTKLIDCGLNAFDTHSASQVYRTVTFSAVTLTPGIYWWVTASTDAAGSATGYGNFQWSVARMFNQNSVRMGTAANLAVAGALPATLGTVTGFTGNVSSLSMPHITFVV